MGWESNSFILKDIVMKQNFVVGLKQQAEEVTFTSQTVFLVLVLIFIKNKKKSRVDYSCVLIVHGCSETALENMGFI